MDFLSRFRIKTRLFVFIAGIFLISLTTILLVVFNRVRSMQERSALNSARIEAEKYASLTAQELEKAFHVARSASSALESLAAKENPSREEAIGMLSKITAANPEFVGMSTCWEPNAFDGRDSEFVGKPLHDATGRFIPYIYFSGGSLKMEALVGYETPGDGDWYLKPRAKNNETIIDPYIYNVGGKDVLMTTISTPIRKNGKFAGIVTVDISLEQVQKIAGRIKPYETGYGGIISFGGVIAAHIKNDFVGKKWSEVDKGYEAEYGKKIRNGEIFSITRKSVDGGGDTLHYYVPIKLGETGEPWSVAVVVPVEKIMEDVRKLSGFMITIGAVSMVVILLVIILIANSILKGIKRMNHMMSDISEGEGDLTARIEIDANDEVADLADNFNTFVNKIEELVISIQGSAERVMVSSDEVSGGNTQLSSATQEMASSLEETAASVEEITSSIRETADASSSTSREMVQTANHAEAGSKMMDKMSVAMKDLRESGEKIKEIVDVVNNIAFQTNLLSLNAAVEAARAGEEGKGFAVVAGEVRNLAARSADAAKEIRELVERNDEFIRNTGELSGKTIGVLMDVIKEFNMQLDRLGIFSSVQRNRPQE